MANHQQWQGPTNAPLDALAKLVAISVVGVIVVAVLLNVFLVEQSPDVSIPLPQPCQQYDTLIRDKVMYSCFNNGTWKRIEGNADDEL